MALFGKKSPDTAPNGATATTPAAPRKGFGRKKGGDAAPVPAPVAAPSSGVEDFSDFSDASATQAAPVAVAPRGKSANGGSKSKALKNGVVVGLNIGNDCIKAVEVRARNGQLSVTSVGIVPTPPESVSNGVVMSVSALSGALRQLWASSRFKTTRVVSSVAGAGALVVRVIEVPQMSDGELADNMKMDVDRYIPFPPSEVVMDFKALRDLPSASGENMEVLLAAAQREVVDLHIKVLQDAKLSPVAIDVEPLAASRALMRAQTAQGYLPDYSDVWSLINIGATGTEISVLRGDLLVFTRTVPAGGNALTQALVDTLGLSVNDAEQTKMQRGDALPPHGAYAAPAPVATADDFGFDDNSFGNVNWDAPSATNAIASDDPFAGDPFATAQTQAEPRERPGQIESDQPAKKDDGFDFGAFSFEETPDTPQAATPTDTTLVSVAPDVAPAPQPMSAPDAVSVVTPIPDATPTLNATPSQPAAPKASGFDFSFDLDDAPAPPVATSTQTTQISTTPTVILRDEPLAETQAQPSVTEVAPVTALEASPFDSGDEVPGATTATMAPAEAESAYDLSSFAVPGATATTAAAPSTATAGGIDLDNLDDLFGAPGPVITPVAGATADPFAGNAPLVATAPVPLAGNDPFAAPDAFGGDPFAGTDPFAASFGGDVSSFGSGLGASSSGAGQDEAALQSAMAPVLDELANEIRRSLEYHASRYPDAIVRRIVLVGGGARLRNIDAYLAQTLGIPTQIGDGIAGMPLQNPQLAPQYVAENAPTLAVAAGLAMRQFTS